MPSALFFLPFVLLLVPNTTLLLDRDKQSEIRRLFGFQRAFHQHQAHRPTKHQSLGTTTCVNEPNHDTASTSSQLLWLDGDKTVPPPHQFCNIQHLGSTARQRRRATDIRMASTQQLGTALQCTEHTSRQERAMKTEGLSASRAQDNIKGRFALHRYKL